MEPGLSFPSSTEDVVEAKLIDEIHANRWATMPCFCPGSLARDEGIFVGISAGATLAGALAVAEKAEARLEYSVHVARHRGSAT